jgi:hypothetical protein
LSLRWMREAKGCGQMDRGLYNPAINPPGDGQVRQRAA